jgi:hypothetical protein
MVNQSEVQAGGPPISAGSISKPQNDNKQECMTENDFEQFWNDYPKKQAKKTARQKFLKLRRDILPQILGAIEKKKKTKQWTSGFIENPTTFINQERWDDEEPEPLLTAQQQENKKVSAVLFAFNCYLNFFFQLKNTGLYTDDFWTDRHREWYNVRNAAEVYFFMTGEYPVRLQNFVRDDVYEQNISEMCDECFRLALEYARRILDGTLEFDSDMEVARKSAQIQLDSQRNFVKEKIADSKFPLHTPPNAQN